MLSCLKKIVQVLILMSALFPLDFAIGATDTLNIGIGAEFENLNPIISSQAATKYMLYLAHRPLIVLTPDLQWKPQMIKEIPTLQNKLLKLKGKSLEMVIEILPEMQWGDGVPVTCRDIDFSVKVGKSKNVSIPDREKFDNISSVVADKSNPKKCTITFAKAKFDYFANLPEVVPAHLEEPVFDKFSSKPEGYDQNSLYTKNPTNPGLYNGPYVISEVKLGSHVIFTPNPKFLGKKPYFKKIVIKLIPNTGTLEANLRSQSINMISSAGGFSLDQAVVFDKKVKSENLPYQVVFEDGVVYAHIDFNLNNPILSDLKVRKALAHALNKKEMIDSLLEGKGRVADHFVTDKDPWYTDKVPKYEYSPRTANRLLDEAGWKKGPDGIRVKDGKKLTLTIIAAAGVKLNDNIETYVQEQWKNIGVQLNIKNEPARVFFGDTVRDRNFDLAMYSWVSIPDNSPRSVLHSTSIPTVANAKAGQNYTGYKNKEVDTLIDKLETELDAKKRAEIGKKILTIYATDLPVLPLYYRANNAVIPAGLKNYRLSGHLYYETLNVEDWTF
jgi:peptide/nickel transport system substrate-binding protein